VTLYKLVLLGAMSMQRYMALVIHSASVSCVMDVDVSGAIRDCAIVEMWLPFQDT